MKHFRSSLTRLKTLIEQRLPDGKDIYGYQGIDRASLITAIDSAYTLSQEIKEEAETRFEVISLIRAGSDLYKTLKDYLESEAAGSDKTTRFNDFLNALSALIEKTKITYYLVASHGIRNDEELAHIRSRIADLTVIGDELKEQQAAVTESVTSIEAAVDGITANHKTSGQIAADIKQWHATTAKQYAEIEETHEAITGWDAEVQKCTAKYQALSSQISELAASAEQSRDKLKSDASTGEQMADELKRTAKTHKELLDEIRQTLEGANRVGMAASFKERKDELRLQQTTWQVVFVGAVSLISLAVWKFVLPTLTTQSQNWRELLVELGVVFPLIWLGWFAAKQYGYTSKIREDYAFKCAAAMAYEGHKKAAREVDPELERILLEFSLYNMSQNPIRLYGEGDIHGTPLHEVMDQLLRKFPTLKKVSADVPSLARFEISGQKEQEEKDK